MRIYISLFLRKSENHKGLFLTEIVFDKLSISDSLEMTNWFDNLRLFTIFRSLLHRTCDTIFFQKSKTLFEFFYFMHFKIIMFSIRSQDILILEFDACNLSKYANCKAP